MKCAALFIVMTFVIAFAWRSRAASSSIRFNACSSASRCILLSAPAVALGASRSSTSPIWSRRLQPSSCCRECGAGSSAAGRGHNHGRGDVDALWLPVLLLRLEDYALLAGSVGLFVMLALMFMTRRVNWCELKLGEGTAARRA
jgi:hypothetical protein